MDVDAIAKMWCGLAGDGVLVTSVRIAGSVGKLRQSSNWSAHSCFYIPGGERCHGICPKRDLNVGILVLRR